MRRCPDYEVELNSGEAKRTGACVEDALDEQEAAESSADLVEDPEPIFLEDVDPNSHGDPALHYQDPCQRGLRSTAW